MSDGEKIHDGPGKRLTVILLLAAAAALAPSVLKISSFPPYLCDEVYYFALAKHLAAGLGFVDACFPGNPPHLQYPLFDPVFINFFLKTAGDNYFLLRLAHLLPGILALLPVYALAREKRGAAAAWAVVLLSCASAGYLPLASQIRPDLFFTLFAFCSVLCVSKMDAAGENSSMRSWIAGTVFFFWMAYLSRQTALVLPAALAFSAADDHLRNARRQRNAKLAALALISAGAAAYMLLTRSGTNYATYFSGDPRDVLVSFLRSGYALVFYGVPAALTGLPPKAPGVAPAALSAAVACGFFISAARRRSFLDHYFAVYILLLLFYPPTEYAGARFLVPVVPVTCLYFLEAAAALAKKSPGKTYIAAVVLLFPLQLAVNVRTSAAPDPRVTLLEQETPVLASWLKDNTPPGALLLSNEPVAIHLYSGRKSVKSSDYYPVPELKKADTALAWISRQDIDYIVADGYWKRTCTELYPAIGACPGCFTKVYDRPPYSVYKVKKAELSAKTAGPSGQALK